MSAITAKASRKMKKYAVLTREPRCFLGSFDFSWEQRKFEEIAVRSSVICSDDTLPRVEYEDIVSGTGRLNKDIYAKQSIKSGIAFHQGDVLYGKLRPYLQNWLLPTFDGLAVGDFWVLQPQNADSSFLYRLIQSRQFDEVANQSTGTKMPRADWKLVSKTVFSIPSNISEQAAIGTYFTALDSLITLHQRKCALLFSPFQALISMMFTTSTFSWEQRKLGDIGKARSGVGFPDTDQGGVTGVPFFKVSDMNLDGNENEMIVANNYVTAEQIADHRWSPITELPAIFFAKVGAAVMLNRKRLCRFPFLLDNNTMAYSLSPTKWDADFAKALFGTVDLTSLVQVGALPSYNAGDVESMGIYLPSLFEQEQIGAFFKLLDNLITLHQRKCISFTGRAGRLISTVNKKRITSSWEQRKLGDIADIVGGGTPSTGNQSYWDGDIDWYAPAEIADQIYANSSQKKITGLGYENSSAKMLPPGTVLFTSRAGIGKTAILTRKGCTNQGFQSIVPHRGELDSYFIFSRTGELKRYGELVGAGSTFVEVSGKQMAVMELMMPPTMREQQTIGGFFQQLDHLITLHQRKPFLMKWRNSDANRNQTNRLVL